MRPPEVLEAGHELAKFSCGQVALDNWLRGHSLRNQDSGASRTYVACDGGRVVGYYALAVGALSHKEALGRVRRNMPEPVPVMMLGRLAVDEEFQGKGIGGGLLLDASMRCLQVAEIAGLRAMIVDAKDEPAKQFYERYGFKVSPVSPLKLMATTGDMRRMLSGTQQ